jgi:glutathione S-transferase
MTIQLTAFRWVPEMAQGYVRDLRIRWALEEAGFPYEVVLLDAPGQAGEGYRQWQPFGQVPAYRDATVEMFESAAIVLHIAAQSQALAPKDPAGWARVHSWVIAAINSIEPHAQAYIPIAEIQAGEAWAEQQRPQVEAQLFARLEALTDWLGEGDYLVEGRFTAADLMMTMVIRELVGSGALARFPTLDAYRQRCEARPGFVKSLEDQLRTFRENTPPD